MQKKLSLWQQTISPFIAEKWSSYLDSHKVKYVFIDDEIIYGDVNIDGTVNMSDAVLIMQALSNPNKYSLTEEQKKSGCFRGF